MKSVLLSIAVGALVLIAVTHARAQAAQAAGTTRQGGMGDMQNG